MKKFPVLFLVIVLLITMMSPSSSSAASFKDTKGYWAESQINFLSSKQIINGYPDGSFKPDAVVTRGQAAVMIVRALNLSTANRPKPQLKDVSANHSAYAYIATVLDEGIFPKGKTFSPDKALTREEMARVITNSYKLSGKKDIVFKDVPLKYWAQPYISLVAEHGITAGYSNGTFKPKDAVTRGQFSVFMSRCLDDKFKVNPPSNIQKTTPVLMKDITFNMNFSQVKNRETRSLLSNYLENGEGFLTYQVVKFGYNAELSYLFSGNKLIFITYNFLPYKNDYHTSSEIYSIHNQLHNQAVKEFGTDFNYLDDSYIHTSLLTMWSKSNHTILLSVNDKKYYTEAVIGYSSQVTRTASLLNKNSIEPYLEQLKSLREKVNAN